MIDKITASIAKHLLEQVPSLSKSGGIAQVIQVRSGDTVRRLPACQLDPTGDYTGMLPDSMESAVSFFQVVSSGPRATATGRLDMTAVLRLVLWTNGTKIYPNDADKVMLDILAALATWKPADLEGVAGISVKAVNYEPKGKSVFNAYSFDEAETQFLLPPFDWRTVQIRVLFSVLTGCSPGWVSSATNC